MPSLRDVLSQFFEITDLNLQYVTVWEFWEFGNFDHQIMNHGPASFYH